MAHSKFIKNMRHRRKVSRIKFISGTGFKSVVFNILLLNELKHLTTLVKFIYNVFLYGKSDVYVKLFFDNQGFSNLFKILEEIDNTDEV